MAVIRVPEGSLTFSLEVLKESKWIAESRLFTLREDGEFFLYELDDVRPLIKFIRTGIVSFERPETLDFFKQIVGDSRMMREAVMQGYVGKVDPNGLWHPGTSVNLNEFPGVHQYDEAVSNTRLKQAVSSYISIFSGYCKDVRRDEYQKLLDRVFVREQLDNKSDIESAVWRHVTPILFEKLQKDRKMGMQLKDLIANGLQFTARFEELASDFVWRIFADPKFLTKLSDAGL